MTGTGSRTPPPHSPAEALNIMSVPGWPGVYMLNAGRERLMSTHSQQVRAVSLVGALLDPKIPNSLKSNARIGLVGGGIAAVTAATAALFNGLSVDVFESRATEMSTFEGSDRWLEPNLYRYPHRDWMLRWSNLPFMRWMSDRAKHVTQRLRELWDIWQALYSVRLRVFRSTKVVEVHPGLKDGTRPNLSAVSSEMLIQARYDAIIMAVGFGKESVPDRLALTDNDIHRSHWEARRFLGRPNVLVSGKSDGALAELIARSIVRTKDGRHLEEDLLREFLCDLDSERQRCPGHSADCTTIGKLPTPWAIHLNPACLISSPWTTKMAVFPLNEMLGRFLRSNKLVDDSIVGNGSRTGAAANTTWMRAADGNISLEYATGNGPVRRSSRDVVFRHGPLRPLESDFPKIWQAIGGGTTGALDDPNGVCLARTEPEKPGKVIRIYSDLFDSVTQRLVFEAICDKNRPNRHHRRQLVALYTDVLVSRLKDCRVHLVLSDNQVFDGPYFVSLCADPNDQRQRLNAFKNRILIYNRQRTLLSRLLRYVSTPDGLAVAFEFSVLSTGRLKVVKWLAEQTTGWETWTDFLQALRKDLPRQAAELKACTEALNGIDTVGSITHLETPAAWQPTLSTSFEDPGGFVHQLDTNLGRDVAVRVFHHRATSKRSEVYGLLDQLSHQKLSTSRTSHSRRLQRSDIEGIRSWYDRAYNRAIARQHSADIFETTHLHDSLWWARANQRDHEEQWYPARESRKKQEQERGRRLLKLLRSGVSPTSSLLEVPDGGTPAVPAVPFRIGLLSSSRASTKRLVSPANLSLVECFKDQGDIEFMSFGPGPKGRS